MSKHGQDYNEQFTSKEMFEQGRQYVDALNINKIDLSKIRGRWQTYDGTAGNDDTIESIKLVAEIVNELIDLIAKHDK